MNDIPKFSIGEVLEHYGWDIPYERSGWVKTHCQSGLHDDRNPSAAINFDEGYVKCFACDFGGDAISVVQFYEEGIGFLDAVNRCKAVTGNSDGALSDSTRSRGSVPGRAGSNASRSIYTPPWVRSRSAGGA